MQQRSDVASLSLGFRQKYLDFQELSQQLQAWAKAYPDFVRLESLGRSTEGREVWCLILGREPDRLRPAVWLDGNMHASELCGSSVALAIAEDMLQLHLGRTQATAYLNLPSHQQEFLQDVLFYIVPRISPDGAEHVLKTGRYVRSSPVDDRVHKGHAYWRTHDVDGDGQVKMMRRVCPTGELVESKASPGVMLPRAPEDAGPFYKVFAEGSIENFDGQHVPSPGFFSDNQYDFNRNFPYSWAPEPEQAGAGDYPGSAPEIRAVMDFVSKHPNIFAWTNLHTFGGVFIRPGGDHPDHKMDQEDLAVYRQLEAWATEFTGYPTVSGFHEFLYEPEKPLRGDLTDYAYKQRGAIAQVCELWDVFKQLGIERKKPFIDHYTHFTRQDYETLAAWDKKYNKGRIFKPWTAFQHPQLGAVEIGGPDMRVGISNPPYEYLDGVCQQQSAVFLRMATLVPRVDLSVKKIDALADGRLHVQVCVRNTGYLATYGVSSAKQLPLSEPLRLQVHNARILAPAEQHIELGHLQGWGQGLHYGRSIFLPYTRGSIGERHVSLFLEPLDASKPVELEVSSCRVGTQRVVLGV